MPGTLFVVATPIGNLEDITLRALRVLREVDLIACEDTRQTSKLLSNYDIQKATTSYHEHNEIEKTSQLLRHLEAGEDIALVSDAGTPCVSDPGYRLVRGAREKQIPVVPIPGPCAFIAALSASGRSTHAFVFLGFLPARRKARPAFLKSLSAEDRTLIFFESPARLLDCLNDLMKVLGPRQLTVARELTKMYEELFSGTPQEAIGHFSAKPVRGEVILIVEGAVGEARSLESEDLGALRQRVSAVVERLEISRAEAIRQVAREMKVSRRALYQLLIKNEAKGESH
jgi:16S rRNA (cytidine1402-2'-O)-methyltransferase